MVFLWIAIVFLALPLIYVYTITRVLVSIAEEVHNLLGSHHDILQDISNVIHHYRDRLAALDKAVGIPIEEAVE